MIHILKFLASSTASKVTWFPYDNDDTTIGHNTTESHTNPYCVNNGVMENSHENQDFSTEFLQSMLGNHCAQDLTMYQGYNLNNGF